MRKGGIGKSSLFVFVCCVFLSTCPIPPFLIPPFPFSRIILYYDGHLMFVFGGKILHTRTHKSEYIYIYIYIYTCLFIYLFISPLGKSTGKVTVPWEMPLNMRKVHRKMPMSVHWKTLIMRWFLRCRFLRCRLLMRWFLRCLRFIMRWFLRCRFPRSDELIYHGAISEVSISGVRPLAPTANLRSPGRTIIIIIIIIIMVILMLIIIIIIITARLLIILIGSLRRPRPR